MALEPSVVNLSDLNPAWPLGADPASISDDNHRNIKKALLNAFAGFTGSVLVTGVDGGTANVYTVTPANPIPAYSLKMLVVFSPTAANSGASTINISGLGAKNLVSVSGATLLPNELVSGSLYIAVYDGTKFLLAAVTKNYVDQTVVAGTIPAQSLGFYRSDGLVSAFTKTHTGYAQNEVKGSDVPSASTIDLTSATGNFVHVTGTTGITGITIPVGAERTIVFDGVLTLTHSASLLLPGAANITTEPNSCMKVRGDASGAIVTSYARANGAPVSDFGYLKVSDQKPSGTNGGSNVASDITQTRVLNTVEANTISGASLASNTITLPAGTYRYSIRVPAYNPSSHKSFLYNTTDSVYVGIGSTSIFVTGGGSLAMVDSWISGKFTITASKNFMIRYYDSVATATYGLGFPSSTGQVEVYSEAEFWKVA